jgi:hypothetical protein
MPLTGFMVMKQLQVILMGISTPAAQQSITL